jgi:hypothetical protein
MRGRRVVVLSLAVVAVGVMVALGALYLDPARAAVGPMPGVGMALPAQTRMVTGLDVRRFVASPFYQRYSQQSQGRLQAFRDLEARTGVSPERDVDQILLASQKDRGAAVIVLGRFDRKRVVQGIERQRGVTTASHEGGPLYVFQAGATGASSLAFLGDNVLVMGTRGAVEQTVTSFVKGQDGLKGNPELLALVQSVRPGATFWTAGDQSLLSALPSAIPAPGGGGASLTLPGMKSLVVTGDLDPSVSFEAVAQAADDNAARQLGDVIRGLIALATLQASQKPELQQLASALTVTTEASRVRVNGRVTYELLDALQRGPAGRLGPASPAPVR